MIQKSSLRGKPPAVSKALTADRKPLGKAFPNIVRAAVPRPQGGLCARRPSPTGVRRARIFQFETLIVGVVARTGRQSDRYIWTPRPQLFLRFPWTKQARF